MTAETRNARAETYTFDMIEDAWGDAVPLTKPYFNRFRARLETLRQSAAPPPAAEGVQAGEVSAEDVAVLHRIKAALPDVGVNGWYEGVQALDRVLSSLSQPAEARGVVDGWRLVVRYGEYDSEPGVWAEKDGSLVWIAALTGERNG